MQASLFWLDLERTLGSNEVELALCAWYPNVMRSGDEDAASSSATPTGPGSSSCGLVP